MSLGPSSIPRQRGSGFEYGHYVNFSNGWPRRGRYRMMIYRQAVIGPSNTRNAHTAQFVEKAATFSAKRYRSSEYPQIPATQQHSKLKGSKQCICTRSCRSSLLFRGGVNLRYTVQNKPVSCKTKIYVCADPAKGLRIMLFRPRKRRLTLLAKWILLAAATVSSAEGWATMGHPRTVAWRGFQRNSQGYPGMGKEFAYC